MINVKFGEMVVGWTIGDIGGGVWHWLMERNKKN